MRDRKRNFEKMFNKVAIAKTIGVKPYIDDHEKILQIAKRHKITKSEVLRTIIHDWFMKNEGKDTQ